ncbi:CHAP domain-containing protein [Tessaracoccus sp.]
MAPTAEDVIRIASAEVGYHEGRSSSGHWNNIEKYAAEVPGLEWANGQAWCDVFTSWVFLRAGFNTPGGPSVPIYAYTGYTTRDWKAMGRWSEYPAVGAQVMFGASGGNVHTGIVVAYDATTITTVEGNTNTNGSAEGDGVYVKRHQRTDPYVYGYGYPQYPAGIQSADPAWAHQNPGASSGGMGGIGSGVITPPAPPAQRPQVSLSRLLAAIRHDGPAAQGATSYPADVRPVEQALAQRGFLPVAYANDGSAGTSSFGPGSAYQRLQLAYGFRGTARGQAADGYPGAQSLARLARETGKYDLVG